jgi:ribonuclease HI
MRGEIKFKDEYLNHIRFCGECWSKVQKAMKGAGKAPASYQTPTVGIACDASCYDGAGTKARDGYYHGKCEWQAVDLSTGEFIFRSHLQQQSTINLAEFIAIVDCLKWLSERGDNTTPVYSDSKIAINWVKRGYTNTALPRNSMTMEALDDAEEALNWVKRNDFKNPVLWWSAHRYGPMPADFNRK